MKSRIIALLILAAMTFTLVACTDPFAKGDDPTEIVERLETMAYSGRLVVGKNSYLIIRDEDLSPISMSVDGSADEFFDGYNTGDRIEVVSSLVAETYPCQAHIYSVKSIEKGSADDIPSEIMSQLREMGWVE